MVVICGAIALDEDALRRLEIAICAGEGASPLSVSLVVVGDAESRVVNRKALDHDYATDVVAFDLRDAAVDESGVDGEIYVNAEMAVREAPERGCSPESELLFYVAHGLLHLLGYDDATPEQRTSMHGLQRRYLEAAGIDPPRS